MISNRPMIPMLTHVDNLGDLNLDMTSQEQSLEKIANNTDEADIILERIETGVLKSIDESTMIIETNTNSIRTSSANTATATSSINSAVGTSSDASTENTVIGLLKSIVNKLS